LPSGGTGDRTGNEIAGPAKGLGRRVSTNGNLIVSGSGNLIVSGSGNRFRGARIVGNLSDGEVVPASPTAGHRPAAHGWKQRGAAEQRFLRIAAPRGC